MNKKLTDGTMNGPRPGLWPRLNLADPSGYHGHLAELSLAKRSDPRRADLQSAVVALSRSQGRSSSPPRYPFKGQMVQLTLQIIWEVMGEPISFVNACLGTVAKPKEGN
ncbi:hypothetical protein CEXT_178951 [Caerostris extrusa]|uniref:Uncharacterized protein n=1 Tax=Caerostris extrusa TaxID=172846 RepID=A0AAV4RZ29_CAEEX|nr:hypothetical protein CEXT_178951 [Caerostris extrusa]